MNETLKRAISGAIYVILLLVSILYSTESFFLLFGVFLLIAVYEFCNLVQINKVIPILFALIFYGGINLISFYKPLTEEIIYSIVGENYIILLDMDIIYKVLLLITILVSLKCIYFLFNDKIQSITPTSKYIYLLGYIILPFVFITKISFGIKDYNPKIIIGLFILIWTNDTFAYIVGKSIGKHKLLERISPKKTIEGLIGGVVFAVFAGFLISKYYIQASPNHLEKSIIIWTTIAIIVGFIGTIGDLIESKFKRIAGVKDSGKIMPGHGGILDRLDSVIFVAPFVYLFYQILNYVS
ncbi:phosphatidate cytidylyltransferase [Flavobacterium sp. CG_23.5]|uniref:phosphatidate cytidylyltransferase n=1 Tax=unclassified Flavobacterium TaxID=196869 RepID=UPI0018CB2127|nr:MULTISPECIES: phosphatidate cytidylyltransferase [unclassified Flavobacterium]MBG6111073.1 phosphatidate cytidylyltransferase [Flavobacterium sp. CG_9.10]MBP2282521.1 phosphatidate cytidylyltransferase [Flavobacterium sp. CG_23.5]